MGKRRQLDLLTFDGKLLDGLRFCRKVYDLIEQVKSDPGGVAKLRIRSQKLEKRLIEELIPLARYVQARYQEGRRIKVRWLAGSQNHDAVLLSSGEKVKHRVVPKELLVEVTTSYSDNDHLARRQLHEEGMTWGPKSISQDKKTGKTVSKPYVFTNDERALDLAEQILKRIKDKAGKGYPPGTVLIVNCFPSGVLLDDEWDKAMTLVRDAGLHDAFREVFLIELVRSNSATLYGKKAERDQSDTD